MYYFFAVAWAISIGTDYMNVYIIYRMPLSRINLLSLFLSEPLLF